MNPPDYPAERRIDAGRPGARRDTLESLVVLALLLSALIIAVLFCCGVFVGPWQLGGP